MKIGKTGLLAMSGLLINSAYAQEKPNVIIIYADDIGYGDFSCNGSETIHTPNVDAVAASGVRFTNAHSTAATSTPSRYSLLIGEYAWRRSGTGIASGDAPMIIKPGTFTMASLFQEAGYTTGAIGKWHLGLGAEGQQDWNGYMTPGLTDIGFNYSFIMAATSDRVPCVYLENQRIVNLDPKDPIEISYSENFPGEPTGKDNPELLKVHPSHGHDNSIVNGVSRIGYMRGGKSALWVDEEIADRITEKAVEFIETNKDKPFFMYFGTNDIHVPRVPHERFEGKSGMGPRGDAILSFDWTVSEIVRVLEENNLRENTILIISSDNGPVVDDGYKDRAVELLGNHKPWGIYRGGKYSAFEAGTRVPCIVSWPSVIKEPVVSDALMSHIDFFASFAGMLEAEIPEGAAIDSWDKFSTWTGQNTEDRDFVVEQNADNTLSLLKGDYKYIVPSTSGQMNTQKNIETGNNPSPQLYNLKTDPGETTNIADRYQDILEEFQQRIKAIRLLGHEIEGLEVINVIGGDASSYNGSGTTIQKSYDDDFTSYYHSKWSDNENDRPDYFPITLNYYFNPTDLECIMYHTRNDGNDNGNFKEFEVWTCQEGKSRYTKLGDYDFEGKTGVFLIDFDEDQKENLRNITAVRFVVKSGVGIRSGYASCAEMIFYRNTNSGGGVGKEYVIAEEKEYPIIVDNNRIFLKDSFTGSSMKIYSMSGEIFSNGEYLNNGIYIVRVDSESLKVSLY